jgi:hypothetical protein
MPKSKTGKPALAGMKPLPKAKGFDPAAVKAAKSSPGHKLVLKRGLVPGKGGHR